MTTHYSTRGTRLNVQRVGLFAAVSFALLLTACPPTGGQPCDTDAECPDGRCRFGACGPICEEDLDCGSRQICSDGQCVERPECAATSDCASGFECQGGECRCTSDQACALNQTCVSGRCETRERCTSNEACPPGQRCELTQGLCIPPCAFATDCAPGLDPQVATVLYQCFQGTCFRRCVNDATCGPGLICADGLCNASECDAMSDCPSGQYCTSANFGRCVAYQPCTSTAQCDANFECRAFAPTECPPGFPCDTPICQELPRCLVDQDCQAALPGQMAEAAYCESNHCQPTKACTSEPECPSTQDCIGGVCVPGGCRGHGDCASTQACVAGECKAAPNPADYVAFSLTPSRTHLEVGDSVQLTLIAYELGGGSFPVRTAQFAAVDSSGQPSTAVSVDASGKVTGVSAGMVRVRGSVPGSAVAPVEATVYVHTQVTTGRRVTVIDAASSAPLAGVDVRGCDAPPATGPCPAPVDAVTNALGEADFPAFTSGTSSFSVGSAEPRPDGLPRYERVSVVGTAAKSVLLPLGTNPVETAAGFNAVISFNQVHSDGNYWVGFAALSAGDPVDMDLQTLLGEPFQISLPGVPQRVPVPGSVVLYTSPGLGIPNEVKGKSLGLGQPGRRAASAFAGRTTLENLLSVRSTDFLAYAGAFDFETLAFNGFPPRPRVLDVTDVDGDGMCTDPQACPLGPETVPDYFNFTALSFNPRYLQKRRTEVVLPDLPPEFDTAVIAAVEGNPETGLVPMGFSSKTAGMATPGGGRPVDPVVMRSGAPSGGVEAGQPGLWVMAVQAASVTTGGGSVSGRVTRGNVLPTRAVVGPLLPTAPLSTWSPSSRAFAPEQPAWNSVVSAGGELARVDLIGSEVRHRIYFAAQGSQTEVRIPDAPQAGGLDPALEPEARLQVSVMELAPGVTATDALDLAGPGLDTPSMLVDAYSRWQAP